MSDASHPAIACIIPAWNAERYVAEAIESVLAQTRVPDEILVVDDGSTDNTAAIAQRYASPVRLIQQANAGTAAARDAGIHATPCELITFLDADDLLTPEKVERQLEHLLGDDTLELSICHSINFWDEQVPEPQRQGVDLSAAARLGQMPTWLIWRSAFDRYGYINEVDSEVKEFAEASGWYRRAKARGLRDAVLPEPMMRRRLHMSNKTRQNRAGHIDAILAMAKQALDERKKGSGQ